MSPQAARLALAFSSVGHFFFHYFAAMYFTIVVAMVDAWEMPYHTLIELWTPAAILIGVAALPAGRLADVWSAPGMMVIMFIGMGLATVACGFADGPVALMVMLALIGLFGAIYHPVGISWLIRNSDAATGKKLAVNGIFGGLGAAGAGAITGLLLEFSGWRAAFILPGVLCVLCGIAMAWAWRTGRLDAEGRGTARASIAAGGGNLRAFLILLFPMFAIGLIYSTTQAAMPKLFEENLVGIAGGNLAMVGGLVGLIYAVGALMQIVGGHLADRYSLKRVYLLLWIGQAPLLTLMAMTGEAALLAVALVTVVANTAALPAENMMLARYTPERHQGIAFGLKFVLAFGAAPIGVTLISRVREATGAFDLLFYGLAVVAIVAVIAILALPGEPRPRARPNTMPAAAE